MVGKSMQMARSPDRAPEPLYALFPSDCLIKKDLKGTCFRWDKPGRGGGFACPRARAIALRLRFTRARGQASPPYIPVCLLRR
jgi:hypothetical protein